MRVINKKSVSAECCVQLDSEIARPENEIKFHSNTGFLGRNLHINSVKILLDRELKRTNRHSPFDSMFLSTCQQGALDNITCALPVV